MSRLRLPRGLYIITEERRGPLAGLIDAVAAAIAGGARAVQYRDKSDDRAARAREAAALVTLCRERGVAMIVNDDVELARATAADGVHLGEHDASVAHARDRLGADALIGVSCYDSLARAESAHADGADYIAFGSFFPSRTKPDARRASVELISAARARIELPIVAIGGITPANGFALVAAGVHALAVVSGVFAQADVRSAARAYAELFEDRRES